MVTFAEVWRIKWRKFVALYKKAPAVETSIVAKAVEPPVDPAKVIEPKDKRNFIQHHIR